MTFRQLSVEGAWVYEPRQFHDDRGVFLESFRNDRLAEVIGHEMRILQTNVSVSSRGTVRGIHFADVPPSQAKYVTALSGSFIDFVVDIRVGSPTFGQWDSVLLDTKDRRAIYIGEGLGHALCALEDSSTVMYLCSATYAPDREHGITPIDPDVALQFPQGLEPLLSAKDAAAPTLAEARERGLLPSYEDCRHYYAELAQR
ncbi:dTDP-4-dehydrorhamnose 3,5-epimerase family protein [Oryzihumus leptocrescens]|uniref:dTDP-4-dehydrorhamnose 3,5-epimerase n=1 Tax=Oryzihumus leptocrescens TaxID=297536 RepID=A0A542ZG58_9MICO|nr:dTDP-4-dehydrorhamnose 3,5-epimerase [Oryzihumus leptocrescens]TQL59323.1 dTDP-4-dehydrorhamnose 3,5-epimerase [Oryzihumus leptocrescens]